MPLEIEHLIPKSRGGSDRVSNLALACHECNQRKGNQTAVEYGYAHLMAQAKQPLKDAAAVNAIRWQLYSHLIQTGLPIEGGTGGRTKFNRTQQGYPKAHWIDAACAGASGETIVIFLATHRPLRMIALGRQRRQMCLIDRYGFPRTAAKGSSRVHGFRTGDVVQAFNSGGKYPGWHIGRIAVRSSGSFAIEDGATVSWKNCRKLHKADGYQYQKGERALPSPP